MIIKVHPHELELIENEKTNEKESYVSDFTFEFDDEIDNTFTKTAYFTKNGTTYEKIILNNKVDYAPEVLTSTGYVEIGVSCHKVVDDKTIRYNPTPITKYIEEGSLKTAQNSEEITPTDKEQIETMLNNINITAEKVDTTTTITITNTDGESQEVEILDGEDGPAGPQGEPGHTPVKGIDYFTPEDIASLNIPTKTSDLNNDSGFITSSTDTLTNYYKKSETYNKTEIDNLLSGKVDTSAYNSKMTQIDTTLGNKANISDIPAKTSDLTNDSDFTTKAYVDGLVGDIDTALDLINGEVIS